MEKRVLGRGLAALIPEKQTTEGMQILESNIQQGVRNISIDKVKANKYQPREDFNQEALDDLACSIKEKGFIQPVLVRFKNNEYDRLSAFSANFNNYKRRVKELFNLYKQSSVNLLISSDEGFGFSWLEAANFTRPSILSDLPVLKEISDGNALFVDPKNPQDLFIKLKKKKARTLTKLYLQR